MIVLGRLGIGGELCRFLYQPVSVKFVEDQRLSEKRNPPIGALLIGGFLVCGRE